MLCGTRLHRLNPDRAHPSLAAYTSREDTHTSCAASPGTTSDLWGMQVARETDGDSERLGERTMRERGGRGEGEGENGGERGMICAKPSQRGAVTAVGDSRQETHHAGIYTAVFKNKRTAFSNPALRLPILLPCAPTLLLSSINLGALPLFPTPLHRPCTLITSHIHTHKHKHTHKHTEQQ